ncbi:MAG: septum formation initiator family protein [Duodenibacillus sp.]|nr:septum formation initiator family protein [Duodenibacillus sp.]
MFVRYVIYTAIIALAVGIQYPLWQGKGGKLRMYELQEQLAQTKAENDRLRQHNEKLAAEVESLEQGHEAIEERARLSLHLVQKGEVLVRFVPIGAADKAGMTNSVGTDAGGDSAQSSSVILTPKR